jgi:hypothetical protein
MNEHGRLPNETDDLLRQPHLCRVCRRPFVTPLSVVSLVSEEAYVVELQCSNCEDSTVTLLDEHQMERLDRELDRQSGGLRHTLAELELADELDEIDRFVEALQAGHILPEDF